MKQGKRGTIEITVGEPERIHKDKSGHLMIVRFDLVQNSIYISNFDYYYRLLLHDFYITVLRNI